MNAAKGLVPAPPVPSKVANGFCCAVPPVPVLGLAPVSLFSAGVVFVAPGIGNADSPPPPPKGPKPMVRDSCAICCKAWGFVIICLNCSDWSICRA